MIEIYPETINLYFIFLGSFVSSSFVCFVQDMYYDFPYIQENKSSKNEILKIYLDSLPLVVFNMFVTIPFTLFISQYFFIFLSPFNGYQVYHIPIFFILIDPTFFTIHRLFHTVKFFNLYKYHKIHHQIKRPVGITSIYLHPIDLIFGNLMVLSLSFFTLNT